MGNLAHFSFFLPVLASLFKYVLSICKKGLILEYHTMEMGANTAPPLEHLSLFFNQNNDSHPQNIQVVSLESVRHPRR